MGNSNTGRLEITGPSDLGTFLIQELGLLHRKWSPSLINPVLAPFADRFGDAEGKSSTVEFHVSDGRPASGTRMDSPWDQVLNQLGLIVGIICAAGGSKAFVSLLKAWVDERKHRKIVVRKGDQTIEIHGGVSERQLREVVEVFETELQESRILRL